MRIIGGRLSGIRLLPPSNLPVRPTTDLAKEALFNILENRIRWDESEGLDLFSGTGNISIEMASRGIKKITAVDAYGKCCAFIREQKIKYRLDQLEIMKADVMKFLSKSKQTYDLIFADPPYDLPILPKLPDIVMEQQLLNPQGVFILEHPSTKKVDQSPFFKEQRSYGYSSFSFFERP